MSENKMLRDLKNGIRVEDNLKKYAALLTEGYIKISFCKLASNFTTYYDDLEGATGIDADFVHALFSGLHTTINRFLVDQEYEKLDDGLLAMDTMRYSLTSKMRQLYDYVHVLGIYEHIMNRLQYKYNGGSGAFLLDRLMNEINQYVMTDQDPSGMNRRLTNVFGELPVRITRTRFLDMVTKGCGYYVGTRDDIADYFFQEMYQQASLLSSDKLSLAYPELNKLVADMEALDLANADEATVNAANDRLKKAGQELSMIFSYDFQLLELINDLMIIMMNMNMPLMALDVPKTGVRIITAYMKAAKDHNFIGMEVNIPEEMKKLNEQHEMLMGMHIMLEDQMANFRNLYSEQIRACQLTSRYEYLRRCQVLSGIDLMADYKKNTKPFIADEAYIKEKTEKLLEQYKQIFADYPMIIRRAVIADALSKLPVVFDSLEDSESFIRQCFENCKERSEQIASAAMIRTIMNDQAW